MHGVDRLRVWRSVRGCSRLVLVAAGVALGALAGARADGPAVGWGSYLGGTGDEMGSAIARCPDGNLVLAGTTRILTGTTEWTNWASGGGDTTPEGASDAFVAKFTPAGGLLWSTYVGGSGEEGARSVAVDSHGDILVCGQTTSSGWASGGWDIVYGGGGGPDGFVAKLSGDGVLLWSSYLGGDQGDQANGVTVDRFRNVIVTGSTTSEGWVSGGWQTDYQGAGDGFVVKLSPEGNHDWSTYFGGPGSDEGRGIVADRLDDILVTGQTVPQSDGDGNPPAHDWVQGGLHTTPLGGLDGFVLKVSAEGAHRWSTYFGGTDSDAGTAIAVDAGNSILVTGYTWSSGWVAGGWDLTLDGLADACALKLWSTGDFVWSTYLGGDESGGAYEVGLGIAADVAGNVLVCGGTASPGWVSGGTDTTHGGLRDAFVVALSPLGHHGWSTYLGAAGTDDGRGIVADPNGNLFVVGYTPGYGAPWLAGGWDTTPNGSDDACVLLLGTPPPAVTSLVPSDDATGVAVGTDLVLTFSRDVAKGASGSLFLHAAADGALAVEVPVTSEQVVVAGSQVTVHLDTTLAFSTSYYVLVDATCFAAAGAPAVLWAGIATPGAWSFTTEADFRVPHTVIYQPGPHGQLTGAATQVVPYDGSTAAVTAIPDFGYVFDHWNDGSAANPRSDTHVTADLTLTALFDPAVATAPAGAFLSIVDATAAAGGRALVDLTGTYATHAAGNPLTLTVVHDPGGGLGGNATCTVGKGTAITMPIKGSAKGNGDQVTATLSLKGTDPGKTVTVSLKLVLTLDLAARQLVGTMTGSIKNAGTTTPVDTPVALGLPGTMDGTWALRLNLVQEPKAITGGATLRLSNGVERLLTVKGKSSGESAVLSLAGAPADVAAKPIKLKLTVLPLMGGWAQVQSLSGKAYGQTLK